MRLQQLFAACGFLVAMCAVVMGIAQLTGFEHAVPVREPLAPWISEFSGYDLGFSPNDRVRGAYDVRSAETRVLLVLSWLQNAEATRWKQNPADVTTMDWAKPFLAVLLNNAVERTEGGKEWEDPFQHPGVRQFSFHAPFLKRFPDGIAMTPFGFFGEKGLLNPAAAPQNAAEEEMLPDPAVVKAAVRLPHGYAFGFNRSTNEFRGEFNGVDGKGYVLSVIYQGAPNGYQYNEVRVPPFEYGRAIFYAALLAIAGMMIVSLLVTRSMHDMARSMVRTRDQGARGLEMPGGFVTEVQEIGEGVNRLVASLMNTVNRIGTMHESARTLAESLRLFSSRLTEHSRRQRHVGDNAVEELGKLRRTIADLFELAGNVGKEARSVLNEARALTENFSGSMLRVQNVQSQQSNLVGYTRRMYKLAKDASADVTDGTRALDKSLSAYRSLHGSVEAIAGRVDKISEIAEQTNLLALNAAIQAASGGEKGKSFALVAEEVRKLADLSADTTKEIVLQVQATLDQINDGQQHLSAVYGVLSRLGEHASELDRTLVSAASALDQMGKDLVVVGEICQRVVDVAPSLVRASEAQQKVVAELTQRSDSLGTADRDLETFVRTLSELAERTGKEALELDRIMRDLMGHSESLKNTISELQEA